MIFGSEEGHLDRLGGGDGDDVIEGRGGWDIIWGEAGDATIYGNAGNDALYGMGGADTIYGGWGDDYIIGTGAIHEGIASTTPDLDDTLFGGPGNDYLRGGLGADQISGGPGDDILLSKQAMDLSDIYATSPSFATDRAGARNQHLSQHRQPTRLRTHRHPHSRIPPPRWYTDQLDLAG